MEESRSMVQISELIDIALGYPEFGVVNFNLIHGLLHVISNEIFNIEQSRIEIIQSSDGKFETILHKVICEKPTMQKNQEKCKVMDKASVISALMPEISSKEVSRKRGGTNLVEMNSSFQISQKYSTEDLYKIVNDQICQTDSIHDSNKLIGVRSQEIWNKVRENGVIISKKQLKKDSSKGNDKKNEVLRKKSKLSNQKIQNLRKRTKEDGIDVCEKNEDTDEEIQIIHKRSNCSKTSDDEEKEVTHQQSYDIMKQSKEEVSSKSDNKNREYSRKQSKEDVNKNQIVRNDSKKVCNKLSGKIDENFPNRLQLNWTELKDDESTLFRRETVEYWNKICDEEVQVLRKQAAECWSKINDLEAELLRKQCREEFSDDASDILSKESSIDMGGDICNNGSQILRKQAQECWSKLKKKKKSVKSTALKKQVSEIWSNVNDKVNKFIQRESVIDEIRLDTNQQDDLNIEKFIKFELTKIADKISPPKSSVDDIKTSDKITDDSDILENQVKRSLSNNIEFELQENEHFNTLFPILTMSKINLNDIHFNEYNMENDVERERGGMDIKQNEQTTKNDIERQRGGGVDANTVVDQTNNRLNKFECALSIMKLQFKDYNKQLDKGNKAITCLQDLVKRQLASTEFDTLVKNEHLEFIIKQLREYENESGQLKNDVKNLMHDIQKNVKIILELFVQTMEIDDPLKENKKKTDVTGIEKDMSLINSKLFNLEKEFCELKFKVKKSCADNKASGENAIASQSHMAPHVVDLHNELKSIRDYINSIDKNFHTITKENENLSNNLNNLLENFNNFKKTRMDNDELNDLLAEKVDYEMLDRKVSYNSFDKNNRSLDFQVEESFEHIRKLETRFSNEFQAIMDMLKKKLDNDQISDIESNLDKKIQEIYKKIDLAISIKSKPNESLSSATRTATRILHNVNCIACDRDVIMNANELAKLPKYDKAHFIKTTKPQLLYNTDSLKKNTNVCEPPKSEINYNLCEIPKKDPNRIFNRYCGGSHTKITNLDRIEKGIGVSPSTAIKNLNKQVDQKAILFNSNNKL